MLRWIVFVLTTWIAIHAVDETVWWPNSKFDQRKWVSAEAGERYVYAKDLVKSGVLIGMQEDEVIALLGPSNPAYNPPSSIQYLIKRSTRGFAAFYILDIRLVDGRVSKAFVRFD